ncbi:MAG: alanyl-tRNA editing protein AlaXM [Thaumarchaeota archaeon]|nr:alanyl-tRNA editing protein AlaXM [Nitrososphaerota archaeon]
MTEKLYWRDMYLHEFDGTVVSIEGNRVILDQTAFYPRGGGLVSDTGKLGGAMVTEVIKENEDVIHLVDHPELLKVGVVVHGSIDWDKRYEVMKMHTTAHILCAIVNRETGALITGNQINPGESRIDFNLESFDRERISDYTKAANDVVVRGLEVKSYFMNREEALRMPGLVKLANALPPSVDVLRIVQIGDVDTQADGGVHVGNTREIGEIVIDKAENKGKNNRRLYFSLKRTAASSQPTSS